METTQQALTQASPAMIDLANLETLRNRGERRLTGVETVRAARALSLRMHLLAGACATVWTSQEGTPRCTRDGSYLITSRDNGRTIPLCEGCARYHLHGAAAFQLAA